MGLEKMLSAPSISFIIRANKSFGDRFSVVYAQCFTCIASQWSKVNSSQLTNQFLRIKKLFQNKIDSVKKIEITVKKIGAELSSFVVLNSYRGDYRLFVLWTF